MVAESKFDIMSHILVPKHRKMSDAEVKNLFKSYNISKIQLPTIPSSDPIIQKIDAKPGDIIEITRKSASNPEIYFRRVIK